MEYVEVCCHCLFENELTEKDIDNNWKFKCKRCGTIQHVCSMCNTKNCSRQKEKGFNCFQIYNTEEQH